MLKEEADGLECAGAYIFWCEEKHRVRTVASGETFGATAALRGLTFVIAHSLSTIRDADLYSHDGKWPYREVGHSQQFISTGGAYTALYNSQFAGTDTPAAELQPGQDQLTVTQ